MCLAASLARADQSAPALQRYSTLKSSCLPRFLMPPRRRLRRSNHRARRRGTTLGGQPRAPRPISTPLAPTRQVSCVDAPACGTARSSPGRGAVRRARVTRSAWRKGCRRRVARRARRVQTTCRRPTSRHCGRHRLPRGHPRYEARGLRRSCANISADEGCSGGRLPIGLVRRSSELLEGVSELPR
jgi:hypothetical protein